VDKHRFVALDGLRGVAALTVLFFHLNIWINQHFFPHGYLSVDLFFILSGFVLAFAYEDKLVAGMSLREFMGERIRRLGPTLWIATGCSFVCILAFLKFTATLNTPNVLDAIAITVKDGVLFPTVGPSTIANAFPFDGPIWSLFAEAGVNVAFALSARWLSNKVLATVVVTGWVACATIAIPHNSWDFGATQSTIFLSLLRAFPAFAAGVLLLRFWRRGLFANIVRISPLALFAIWLVSCEVPVSGVVFDSVQTVLIAPAIIILLANVSSQNSPWSKRLGVLSYPLYAVHMTILQPLMVIEPHAGPMLVLAASVLAIGIAGLIAFRWEPLLRRAMHPRPAAAVFSS
jgi:peptidoglycan/LPS O-acetylase OafA/YrhL